MPTLSTGTVRRTSEDTLSLAFEDMVPAKYRDTSDFLNIVQWNIEWFGASKSTEKDKRRVGIVTDILSAFNADLFIFQEVAGPSSDGRYQGVMDGIAQDLKKRGDGDYVVFYTRAGGEQRVAMMWDRNYLRAKAEVEDLFPKGQYRMPNGKDAFAGRTPLYGHFEARMEGQGRFDFQALGVHLKAMPDGAPQRAESAKVLANWMGTVGKQTDADILIMGDWNAPPDASEWDAVKKVKGVHFSSINDPSDFSYLWLENLTNKFVSRIDLTAMSLASETKPPNAAGEVVRWLPVEDALSRASGVTDKKVREVLAEVKETVSDHMPTITQFYLDNPLSTKKSPKVKHA